MVLLRLQVHPRKLGITFQCRFWLSGSADGFRFLPNSQSCQCCCSWILPGWWVSRGYSSWHRMCLISKSLTPCALGFFLFSRPQVPEQERDCLRLTCSPGKVEALVESIATFPCERRIIPRVCRILGRGQQAGCVSGKFVPPSAEPCHNLFRQLPP